MLQREVADGESWRRPAAIAGIAAAIGAVAGIAAMRSCTHVHVAIAVVPAAPPAQPTRVETRVVGTVGCGDVVVKFEHDFETAAQATLTVAASDAISAAVDGRPLAVANEPGTAAALPLDVTPGAHHLTITLVDRGGRTTRWNDKPAGVAFVIADMDGHVLARSGAGTRVAGHAAVEIPRADAWAELDSAWIWNTPIDHAPAPPHDSATDWQARVASGDRLVVDFDATADKFDDRGFVPDDPMGTLLGGSRYTVTFHDGSFTTTGFNESTNGVGSWTYPNAHIVYNQLSLWGACFTFDRQTGEVFHPDYGLVGHLREP